MVGSSSAPSPSLDESDEPQDPHRTPSRLDFCTQDGEMVVDSPTHGMDWSRDPFCDDCLYTFVEDVFMVKIVSPAPPHPLTAEGGKDASGPSQVANPQPYRDMDGTHTHFPSLEPMDRVAIVPRAPVPVRPPLVQSQHTVQEVTLLSHSAAQRLNYPHHGFSRSALLQQKTFWNSRHDEWAGWQSRTECGQVQTRGSKTNEAYTGIATPQLRITASPPPYMRTPPSGLERDLANHPHRGQQQDVHASIYPRVGDISALRDPYPVNIDRSFFRLPLWTLHKTLYAFDMQQRSTLPTTPTSAYNATHVQASTSSSTLSSYSSSSGDDEDSDSTLVADNSPVQKSQRFLEPSNCASSLHSAPSCDRFCGWEPSWYAKWQLLVGLFQRGHGEYGAFEISKKLEAPLEPRAAPLPFSGRHIFRFSVREDEDDTEGDEDGDYGTLLADSGFNGDFEEECERAMAFYNRELR